MSVGQKRCEVCLGWYRPDQRTRGIQKVCAKPECRRTRKRQADARWRLKNAGYDTSRTAKKRAWAKTYPDYWRCYRAGHPVYTERNREQTRARKRQSCLWFANQDAIQRDPVGYLEGLRTRPRFANQDAMGRSIEGILTYLRVLAWFANPNAMASGVSGSG